MERASQTTFHKISEVLNAPTISPSDGVWLERNFLFDCVIHAVILPGINVGDFLDFDLHVEGTGEFFTRFKVTEDHLNRGINWPLQYSIVAGALRRVEVKYRVEASGELSPSGIYTTK
ncbi:hypothetical protein GIW70_18355 [Pseudomonas syringae]|nr:hypothetical protein [Pseudomonas syringae]MCF5070153.1 hypothetical protein [Pseudomonas syringae]